MPELPEVETTLLGLKPHILNQTVTNVIIRQPTLRWPIPNLNALINNQKVLSITRRAKYLFLKFRTGTMILHLGMSGKLCIIPENTPAQKHDHVDIIFSNNQLLRFTDPRRFSAVLFTNEEIEKHKLIKHLGPEPLSDHLDEEYLFKQSRNKKLPIKSFIMDNKVIVGVGNIYATEALFAAGINPTKPAGKITKKKSIDLTKQIKLILTAAIKQGGTTLKDFTQSNGKPGYFYLKLNVYGRKDEPCVNCKKPLKTIRQQGRQTVYCPTCQH